MQKSLAQILTIEQDYRFSELLARLTNVIPTDIPSKAMQIDHCVSRSRSHGSARLFEKPVSRRNLASLVHGNNKVKEEIRDVTLVDRKKVADMWRQFQCGRRFHR